MKKLFLLFALGVTALTSKAQLYLTGTSYLQNFDGIGTGLPPGWLVDTGATSTSLGTVYGYDGSTPFGSWGDTTDCPTDVFGTGFKNSASYSNSGIMWNATCAVQESESNRALAVRQRSGSPWDPGSAFILHLANTNGCTSFNLKFDMQSLDATSPRVTPWMVDYGFGATPAEFTPATMTPAAVTTGGYLFNETPVSVSFGTSLDNKMNDVWIRIVTLTASTGAGDRTTSGIDSFYLSWTGTARTAVTNVSAEPSVSLTVLGNATSSNINFGYAVEQEGNYNFTIYDLSGRMIHSEVINAVTGTQQIAVNGLNIAPGMYIAKMNNGNSSSVAKIVVQ